MHRQVAGTTLPERPHCGHASLRWKPRLYQELEGPTDSSRWGQAAMGPRCGMRTTKCQLLATSLCVMVSRRVWGGSLQNRGELLPFQHPLGEGQVFPRSVFCGWRASKANCLSYRCSLGGYRRPPALPPAPLIDFWFLGAVTRLQLFHNLAADSKQKGKFAAGRMGGFQKKIKMLVSFFSLEQKREDGAAAVTLGAGRVVSCRWDQ